VRGTAALALLALAAWAGPPAADAEEAVEERQLLARWADAEPDARRRMVLRLDEIERTRRYVDARPVLVDFRGRAVPVAELFEGILEPALETPTIPEADGDPGLAEIHLAALVALEALGEAYAPPRPVRPGTLNLFLGYGARALTASALPPDLRLRLFRDAMRNVRSLEGRVEPDARTAFLIRQRLLPPLLALARTARDPGLRETLAEAASLLFLPAILDEAAQAQLAPLATGVHSRDLLERFYRAGALDELGRVSLARSVAAQARDDPAFAAGAAPLLLELLVDPQLPPRERGELADLCLQRLLPIEVLRATALDLLAVALGGRPAAAEAYRTERAARPGPLRLPRGEASFRFLSIVLLRPRADAPPVVARVVRQDLRHYEPIHAADERGVRRFVGVLVPDARGEHADLLGPPPGLATGKDIRLLRRPLELERIAVRAFGASGDEIEISATLPEDASEPVPAAGASLDHVVGLLDQRLRIAVDDGERRELVRMLVAIDTAGARGAAVRHARGPALPELLPLAERGDDGAQKTMLARLADLGAEERDRALVTLAARRELREEMHAYCREAPPAVAARAAAALLGAGDAQGAEELLGHADKYARACAGALLLRLTPLARGMRVTPPDPPDFARLSEKAGRAFAKEEGEPFARFGRWLQAVLRDPDEAGRLRRDHKQLYIGERIVPGWEFAEAYTAGIRAGKAPELWPALVVFLLDPHDPGAGLADRDLQPLLDALEERAREGELRRLWTDALVVLACAQYGMELDPAFLALADRRLEKLAGADAPPRERRRPGIDWPLWAAGRAK
jgi:hypothetical protein